MTQKQLDKTIKSYVKSKLEKGERIGEAVAVYKENKALKGHIKAIREYHQNLVEERYLRKKCNENKISFKAYENAVNCLELAVHSLQAGYSMGNSVQIKTGKMWLINRDACQEYARSCKYRASHGHLSVRLTKKEFKELSYNKDKHRMETGTHYFMIEGYKANARIVKKEK